MSIRTTVTLDEDVAARLKERSAAKGVPFKALLNQVIRLGLTQSDRAVREPLDLPSHPGSLRPGLSYDDIEALIELGEGPLHR